MKSILLRNLAFFVFALFLFASCEQTETVAPSDQILNPGPQFNIDKFEQNLIEAMEGNATGWAYSISKNGNKYADGAGGDAVVAVRGQGQISQSPNRRMQIASISKPITAIAFYKACAEVGMVVETPIHFYLPQSWDVHESVEQITFGDLLRHRSGFTSGGNDYEGLREMVETGINPSDYGDYDYLNANYGLFRIIIPHMLQYSDMFAIK
ncbi:MAG: serine hydrolase, partial [Bacteroidota bacterium]